MSDLYLTTGETVSDLHELVDKLGIMSKKTFGVHVNSGRNDFSEWISTQIKNRFLAEKIYHVETKEEMRKILMEDLTKVKNNKINPESEIHENEKILSKDEIKKAKKTKASSKDKKSSKEVTVKTKVEKEDPTLKIGYEKPIETYNYFSNKIPLVINIVMIKGNFVPTYKVNISKVSEATEMILEKIRNRLIDEVNLGLSDITDIKKTEFVEDKFKQTISVLIQKYFPDIDDETEDFLTTYLIERSLGLGKIELLMDDVHLEEIVINSATDPVWVYHRKHGWLKTNVFIEEEDQIKHYSSMIGRKVGRSISILEPLLDAHLPGGDRVNATLKPISTQGNTITIRKFARDPWTVTKFLKSETMTPEAAALVWLAIQYEMSILIAGGTASGKTSTLNCFANFFPPNQRVISIEDTREIQLPSFLHWVSMNTCLPNAEGKGSVEMGDLLVNSLRMRPDRIIVGEVRRKREAETLFEAIHTGHSCYATFHANNVSETIERLTNEPINVPRTLLPAISLVVVQFRNRRTGMRRTFQIAEILPDGNFNVLMQYNPKKDRLEWRNESEALYESLKDYTGFTDAEIKLDLKEKQVVLQYLIDENVYLIEEVGRVIAEYYTDKEALLKLIKSTNKKSGKKDEDESTGIKISKRSEILDWIKGDD